MNDLPITFSKLMIPSILRRDKTLTRRVIHNLPKRWHPGKHPQRWKANEWAFYDMTAPIKTYPTMYPCPYGAPGDILFVKEAYQINFLWNGNTIFGHYLADGKPFNLKITEREWTKLRNRKCPYRPTSGRFMYRSLARTFLRVQSIHAERLQDITEKDAKAEGATFLGDCIKIAKSRFDKYKMPRDPGWIYRLAFAELWDQINAKQGHAWKKNEWVWVVGIDLMPVCLDSRQSFPLPFVLYQNYRQN